jgi:peroxiredoxin
MTMESTAESNTSAPKLSRWRRIRQNRWASWAIDLSVFALAFAAISAWQSRELVEAGRPAPAFTLTDMQGKTHDLADYRGEKTFIVFWAPWCPVCGAESDNISRVADWLGDDLNVISVALDYQSRADVQEFIDEHQVDYPVLLGTRQVQQLYEISAYPSLYILDETGAVEHTVAGYTTTFGMLWRAIF